MNKYIKDYGHCCNACRYYDCMQGYCSKFKNYHYGYEHGIDEEPCNKWKIAEDLIEHRPKKQKVKIERVKLL